MKMETKETIGRLVLDDNGKITEYKPGLLRYDPIYKNFEAYANDKSAICYIPKIYEKIPNEKDCYTGQDFVNLCEGQPEIADWLFYEVDGKHPETNYGLAWNRGELARCLCGKMFLVYGKEDTCSYCGKEFLDKEGYIRLHRILWNRIADMNVSGKEADKLDIIQEMYEEGLTGIRNGEVFNDCYLCQYASLTQERDQEYAEMCDYCPLKWGESDSSCSEAYDEQGNSKQGLFAKWENSNEFSHDYAKAAKFARQIANLPEKE